RYPSGVETARAPRTHRLERSSLRRNLATEKPMCASVVLGRASTPGAANRPTESNRSGSVKDPPSADRPEQLADRSRLVGVRALEARIKDGDLHGISDCHCSPSRCACDDRALTGWSRQLLW